MSTEVLSPTRTTPRPSILEPTLSRSTASLTQTLTRPRHDSVVSNGTNSVKSSSSPPGSVAGRSSLDGYESEGAPQAPPIPGFVVASSKRNADFHELFPNVPEMDYLVQDYGCAWHREILVQGRLYISENHLCFYANIFGWVTSLTIPFLDILGIDKRMTAYVIPNAILVTTHGSEYTFASFLTRDTVYDVMHSLWRPLQPPGGQLEANGINGSADKDDKEGDNNAVEEGSHTKHKATECACSKNGEHYSTVVADYRLPGTPEKLYDLMFKDPFMNDFLVNNQKLLDLQIGEWAPKEPDSALTSREMSFIKPLTASIGPKKTKCEIKEEVMHLDVDDYISVLTTTRTPDVPNGNIFSVKTRLCLTWVGSTTTRLVVTSAVEWTGRSFIRSVIDKSAIDGQKQYHQDLEKAMRQHIAAHRAEFVPDGVAAAESESGDVPVSSDAEQQVNQQNTQDRVPSWTKPDWGVILDMAQDAFSQVKRLSNTQALVVLVVVLALSNVWSLLRPAAEPRLPGDAQALKARKKGGKKPEVIDVRVEIRELRRAMEIIEKRLERIESSLNALD